MTENNTAKCPIHKNEELNITDRPEKAIQKIAAHRNRQLKGRKHWYKKKKHEEEG